MNINKLFTQDPKTKKYASSTRRFAASVIDITIVAFLRIIMIQLLGTIWINHQIVRLQTDFKEFFGTDTPKGTPEHMQFIFNHPFTMHFLLFLAIIIFVGALYHALLNASSWQGTIGKRIMKIILVNKEKEDRLGLGKAMTHYFLSVLPFAFIAYLVTFQIKHQITLMQAVTASGFNLFFSLVFLIWIQPHLFTKRKITSYDIICRTTVINKRTDAKYPWK